ncbi:2-oxo-4-hydroxy-4-carboxy-5-ureidoimidazoline decarboxylase [Rhodothalassium salexigens]|uniref:2-oxo-4-hydroxy-4-carboxy-5-ureidoimidazoline decarboxylase n=1 Tax=Rhodothalassium salexigens TaxID=1086 RepID=UPI0019117DE0
MLHADRVGLLGRRSVLAHAIHLSTTADRTAPPGAGTPRDAALSPAPSTLDQVRFVDVYGRFYDGGDWVAEAVAPQTDAGGLDRAPALHAALVRVVETAAPLDQMRLIRAHPDLTQKAAIGDARSTADAAAGDTDDRSESGGIDRCTPEEYATIEALHARYRKRFGLPFILATRGLDLGRVMAALQARLAHDFQAERRTALDELHKIAAARLAAFTAGPDADADANAGADPPDDTADAQSPAGTSQS